MDFRAKRFLFNFVGALLTILLCAASFFALVNVVFNYSHIKTDVYQFSMYPTLNANVLYSDECGDKVYVNKFAPLKRGDVVVASVAWNAKPIIKRLVAGPNDSFYIVDASTHYELFVNEQLFYTMPKTISYPQDGQLKSGSSSGHYDAFVELLNSFSATSPSRLVSNAQGQKMIKLFAGEYLLLGDNWAGSEDALTALASGKTANFVERKNIYGAVDIVVHKGENEYLSLFKQMMKKIFSF